MQDSPLGTGWPGCSVIQHIIGFDCVVFSVQCAVSMMHLAVFSVQCAVCSVQTLLCRVKSAECIVQLEVYSVLGTFVHGVGRVQS